MTLSGIKRMNEITTPSMPASNPIIPDSAMNTVLISFFLAPRLRNMPISFLRSNTDVYMIIAIMMLDTIRDIAANPTNTPVMVFVRESTYPVIMESVSVYFTGSLTIDLAIATRCICPPGSGVFYAIRLPIAPRYAIMFTIL